MKKQNKHVAEKPARVIVPHGQVNNTISASSPKGSADVIAWLSRHALNLAIALCVLALIGMVTLVGWLTAMSPESIEIQRQQQAYFKQVEEQNSTPAGKRAWNRLYRKHGYPALITYEMGKKPYYINAAGQRCPFE